MSVGVAAASPRWAEPHLSAPEGPASRAAARSAALIIIATALSGLAGYVVTALVAVAVPITEYTVFAVLWSALFLVVGAMGGVQQEVARAAHARGDEGRTAGRARPTVVAITSASLLAVVLIVSSPLWSPALLPGDDGPIAAALVVGASSYVLVAVLAGTLYGLGAWVPLAVMIALDGMLRLGLITAALVIDPSPVMLAWAVVIPFPVAVLAVTPWVARRARVLVLDAGYRRIAANAARTVLAAAATAVIISGFPALLRATSPDAPEALLGPLILVLTLTRAPLVIPVMALQSWLIVWFQRDAGRALRRALLLGASVLVVAFVVALLLAAVGPAALEFVFGVEFVLDGLTIAGLVASSGLVAAMCVTGPALIARSQHSAHTAGWLVAAAVLAAALLLPLGVVITAVLALAAGPLVGLAVHVAALARPAPGIRPITGFAPTT